MKPILFIQVFLAFVAGISGLYLLYKLLNSYLKRQFGIQEINSAFAIFQVGILLSGALIMSSVLSAGVNAIQYLNQGEQLSVNNILMSLTYVVLFIAIGIVFTLLVIAASVYTYFQLTQVNEWDQIKQNNIATALISAAFILGISLIMDEYVGQLCEALIPYPSVLQIR
ncbi:MAG: DUF350 domain-containing protein [Bacteroidota bacterium]|jgi:uncharacterized membrane protein YjfL (UPF0719 family)